MKKIIAAAVTAALSTLSLAAQEAGVKVSTRNAEDNSLVFDATAGGYGTFTVRLCIDNIANSDDGETHTVFTTTLRGGSTCEILTIPPRDKAAPVTAYYTWDWLQGKLDALPDLGFIYRIPVADGRSTEVHALTPAQTGMMRNNVSAFRMWKFTTDEGDPVFAIRKGEVIYVAGRDTAAGKRGGGTIIVEHADGTQARYNGLAEESALVAPGDTVYPDTPIASAGQLPEGGYGAHVGLYYYATNRNTGAYPKMIAQTVFINPVFKTAHGDNILTDGLTVTAKTNKRLLEAERGRKNFWQRVFGR